jgi:hypothetical protein
VAKLTGTVAGLALTSFLAFGTAVGGDFSKYRDFRLGTDLATIAKQTGADPTQAKTIHRRPALIQELSWRPQSPGSSSKTEPQEVVFSFYDGELFRIVVNYDRYETEGLTADDMVEAFSASYGAAVRPTAPAEATPGPYGDRQQVVARWQDPQYCFDLIRSSYGPSFRLTGILKRLEAAAQAAILDAKRLDDQEAPQREAARIASEEETAKAKLDKARLVNKPKFQP